MKIDLDFIELKVRMSSILDLIKNPLVIAVIIAAAIAIPVAISDSDEPSQPDFTADPREGYAPLEVIFTDESTGSINSWRWDFDDDGTTDSTEQNPSYTYDNPGTYTVSLSVPGEVEWVKETKTYYISVLNPLGASGPAENVTPFWETNLIQRAGGPTTNLTHGPVVATPPISNQSGNITHPDPGTSDAQLWSPQTEFSAFPRYGNAPLEVVFNDQSIGSINSWRWDFDDDGTMDSTEQNPSYSYNNPGTYTVSLSVSTDNMTWNRETKVDYIAILAPPQADFYSSKTYGYIPHEVQFTDNSTGDINYWNWDFDGDGTVDSWEQNPSYTYMESGKYTVSLTAGEITSSTETKVYYITVLDPRGGGDGEDSDDGGEEPGGVEEPGGGGEEPMEP